MFKKNQIIRNTIFILYCITVLIIATGLIYEITFDDECSLIEDIEISENSINSNDAKTSIISEIKQICQTSNYEEKCFDYNNSSILTNSIMLEKNPLLKSTDFSSVPKKNLNSLKNFEIPKIVEIEDEECEDEEEFSKIFGDIFFKLSIAFLSGALLSNSQFIKLGII